MATATLPEIASAETYLFHEGTDKFVLVDEETLAGIEAGTIDGYINHRITYTPDTQDDCCAIDIHIEGGKPWTVEALCGFLKERNILYALGA